MDVVWAVLFGILIVILWGTNLVGLPGNWMVVASSILYVWLGPASGRCHVAWSVVGALWVLAMIGEGVEFLASAVGAKRAGGSKRAALLAFVFSLLGGIVGLFVGLPIPIIGQVVSAVLFAGIGALVGATLGERWKGRTMDESLQVGQAAFWGRLFGTLGKALVGSIMVVLLIVSLIVE